MKKLSKNRVIAISLVLLFHIIVLVSLLLSTIYYSWPPKDLLVQQQSEILFAGEFVTIGNTSELLDKNMQQPETSEIQESNPEVKGEDSSNSEILGEGEQIVSAEDSESAMEVEKNNPTNEGPTQQEIEQEQLRIKQEQQAAEEINKRVSFNNSGSDGGTQGSEKGNSDDKTSSRSGAPGHSLVGRSLESWGTPSSNVDGTIVVEVRVSPRGTVTDARYMSGTGSAAANLSVRNSCVEESKKSKFSVSKNSTTEQVGTITWRFE